MQTIIIKAAPALVLSTTLWGCGKSDEDKKVDERDSKTAAKQRTQFLKDFGVSVLKDDATCALTKPTKTRVLSDDDSASDPKPDAVVPVELSAKYYITDVEACVKEVARHENGVGCESGFYTTGEEGKDSFKCFCMPKDAKYNANCKDQTTLEGAKSYRLDAKDETLNKEFLTANKLVSTPSKKCTGDAVDVPLVQSKQSVRGCLDAVRANTKCGADVFYTTNTPFSGTFECKCMPQKQKDGKTKATNADCATDEVDSNSIIYKPKADADAAADADADADAALLV